VRVVAEQFAMGDRAKARAVAENMLVAHAGLNGFFASTEPASAGISLALKARGRSGQVRFVGFDFSDAMVEDLRTGAMDAMVVQNPFQLGYQAVNAEREADWGNAGEADRSAGEGGGGAGT
jgi:ribose transport system substrate-binding protein